MVSWKTSSLVVVDGKHHFLGVQMHQPSQRGVTNRRRNTDFITQGGEEGNPRGIPETTAFSF